MELQLQDETDEKRTLLKQKRDLELRLRRSQEERTHRYAPILLNKSLYLCKFWQFLCKIEICIFLSTVLSTHMWIFPDLIDFQRRK
jgi:hypothetical protein